MKNSLRDRVGRLEVENKRILSFLIQGEGYINDDAGSALNVTRKALEAICGQIIKAEKLSLDRNKNTLNGKIERITNKRNIVPKEIFVALKTVQGFGNYGSHDMKDVDSSLVKNLAKSAHYALAATVIWYFKKYGNYQLTEENIHELNLDKKSDATLAIIQKDWIFAEKEYAQRKARLERHNFKKTRKVMTSALRRLLDAPKRSYDEVFLETTIKNIGKNTINRFMLVLESAEIEYRKQCSYTSGSQGKNPLSSSNEWGTGVEPKHFNPLYPSMDIQFPKGRISIKIPCDLDSVVLGWSIFNAQQLICLEILDEKIRV